MFWARTRPRCLPPVPVACDELVIAPMLEKRNLKVDLLALGLLAATVFLAVALLSYNPADPPSSLVYPSDVETSNACGRLGAWIANLMLQGLGIGAYYLHRLGFPF